MITADIDFTLPSADTAPPTVAADGVVSQRKDTLNQLYRQHWQELVTYVRRTFGDGLPDPEDAAQHAFTQYAALENPERVLAPRAFLYRCAINFVIGHKRRNQTRAKFASSPEADFLFGGADEIHGERVLCAKERAAILTQAISQLKPRHREALILNRLHGMTYAEIGTSLKISASEARRLVTVALSRCDRALLAANTSRAEPSRAIRTRT